MDKEIKWNIKNKKACKCVKVVIAKFTCDGKGGSAEVPKCLTE